MGFFDWLFLITIMLGPGLALAFSFWLIGKD